MTTLFAVLACVLGGLCLVAEAVNAVERFWR